MERQALPSGQTRPLSPCLLPDHVVSILTALTTAQYQAYVVGGAVRDLLRGEEPQDYDIATDAKPEDVIAIAGQQGWKVVDKLGRNFGVVLLVVKGHKAEVATFRGERYGADSHRPETVWYAATIEEDLSRRDFTVNAIALTADGMVIDPYGGQRDLAARVIKTVDDANIRFAEDGLRMFRACRLAAQLNFVVDEATLTAVAANVNRSAGLSLERVRAELDKMIVAPAAAAGLDAFISSGLAAGCCRICEAGVSKTIAILPELGHLVAMPQNPQFHAYDCWRHTLMTVHHSPPEAAVRWAALFHDVAKGLAGIRGTGKAGQITDYGHDKLGTEMTAQALARLHLPGTLRKRVVWLVANHMRFHFHAHENKDAKGLECWVRAEAQSGHFRNNNEMSAAFAELIQLGTADALASGKSDSVMPAVQAFGKRLQAAVRAMPVHTADVAYEAEKLLVVLGEPSRMGPFLTNALRRIQDGQLANRPGIIVDAARRWAARQDR